MFGNLQGWIIGMLLVVATGTLILFKGRPEARSTSTGRLNAAMTPIVIEPDPATLVLPGDQDLNAAQFYRQLAEAVVAKDSKYRDFEGNRVPKRTAAKDIAGDMDLLIQGGKCTHMDLFASSPATVVNYLNRKPILPELQRAGGAAITIAVLWIQPDSKTPGAAPADPQKGRDLLAAAFHLGRFLVEERVSFEEYRIGLDLMRNAAAMIARYGDVDQEKKTALQLFAAGSGLGSDVQALLTAMTGIPEEGKMMAMPGDIFDIAINSTNAMWRAEAVLKLGRMRFMSGVTQADQRDAQRVVAELAAHDELPPNVKAAAIAARDLTVERFRMIGGSA